jgi:putative oxidoreductase
METRRQEFLNSVGLLILRVGFGVYMMVHGWTKVQMILDGNFENFPDPIGIGKTASAILVALAEFGCAALVIVGVLTRFAALPIVFAMAVAAFIHHSADPWAGPKSREMAMLFLSAFLALVFTGPGKISIDALIWKRPPQA